MPIYSARIVLKPRKPQTCAMCKNLLIGHHLTAYGCAHEGEKPYHMRSCYPCSAKSADPKIQEAWKAYDGC